MNTLDNLYRSAVKAAKESEENIEGTWSVFMAEIFNKEKNVWEKELRFYVGDFSKINIKDHKYLYLLDRGYMGDFTSDDERFKDLDGRRKQLIFMGTISRNKLKFPVKYPLHLDNGKTITKEDIGK